MRFGAPHLRIAMPTADIAKPTGRQAACQLLDSHLPFTVGSGAQLRPGV